jgi:hypothetical protein
MIAAREFEYCYKYLYKVLLLCPFRDAAAVALPAVAFLFLKGQHDYI